MTARVVARWAGSPRAGEAVICDECGEAVATGGRCPGCYQLAPEPVGMLATVVDTPAGPRLVITERDPSAARWVPTRVVPATGEAVRMVRRAAASPDDTATAPVLTRMGTEPARGGRLL